MSAIVSCIPIRLYVSSRYRDGDLFAQLLQKLKTQQSQRFMASLAFSSYVFTGLRSESDGFKAAVLLARQMPGSLTFPNFHSVANARSQITQALSAEWEEEWLSSAPTCTKLFFPDVASAHTSLI
ncbi:hypothetical protein DAPPUDRAFT_264146 [Daphnia pulex]|uniref:Uncharacterized protein n=1 Tax=Daphnia pulex TaxID=6669 RepID=E9HQZ2_DAPPU|nr:hypothetical protein DAPPUDRAFT_264146 [Daphnia pulex]|eukprot:EFX65842.1 hypothetical protein DAPPUDRAFT_264146 [Daphnia pulex]